MSHWSDAIVRERGSLHHIESLQGLERVYWPRLIESHTRGYRYLWHAVPHSPQAAPYAASDMVPAIQPERPLNPPYVARVDLEENDLSGILPQAWSLAEQAEIDGISRSLFS